jgi:hypothetical protein
MCHFKFLWRLGKTFLDNMTIIFSVVVECFRTIYSKMTKSFATKALDNTHVSTFWLVLYYISHVNKIRDRAMLLHSVLIEEAFLLIKKNSLRHVFKEGIGSQFIRLDRVPSNLDLN